MEDFNYPDIDWENYNSRGDKTDSPEYKFVDTVQDCFLFQHINKPTRWKGTQKPNILDLILTNEEQMVNNIEYSSPLGKSDHCMLSFEFNCYIRINISQRNIRLYNRGRFQEFRESLDKMEWESLLSDTNDIDQNWNKFNEIMKKLETMYIPTRKYRQIPVGKGNTFPMDEKTREKIREKNRLSKMAITSRDPEIQKKYNRVRNQVKSHVNKLKKKYEKDLVQRAKENPKVIWKYIKSKSKTRDGISDLHMNPADTKSPKTDIDEEKAEILAKYFLSVFTTETNGNIPNLELNQSINPISSLEISEENILKMLNTLKIDKSPGPDELHPRVLKEISSSITKPLYHIFKQSLDKGKLPSDWKTALVSAIFKKGNKSLASNYRPVSLTSVVCKIMEKLVRSRILNRMKSQNLFTKRQYGFISGRSTSL